MALYQLAPPGIPIPITNVYYNYSMGSTTLVYAAALVCAGDARSASTLGALGTKLGFPNCTRPRRQLLVIAESASPESKGRPPIPHVLEAAAEGYLKKKYGGGVEHLAKISEFYVTFFCLRLVMHIGTLSGEEA